MTSTEMKEAALYWLHFEKRLTHICTEFGPWNADLVGASVDRMIELEVKTYDGDLRRDFAKSKHRYYKSPDEFAGYKSGIPNYFGFMVTKPLEELAIELCEKNNPRYGVVVYNPESEYWNSRWKVARRMQRLHKDKTPTTVLEKMANRMATEIVAAHMLKHRMDESKTYVVDELKRRFATPEVHLPIYEEGAIL